MGENQNESKLRNHLKERCNEQLMKSGIHEPKPIGPRPSGSVLAVRVSLDEVVHGPDVARQMRRERERAVTPPAPGDVYVELADMPQERFITN